LNKKFRVAQKNLDREYQSFQNVATELERGLSGGESGEITRLLGGVADRLQVFKRKAEESISEELNAGAGDFIFFILLYMKFCTTWIPIMLCIRK
jgi:macrophage erythroblast attacher